MYTRTYAFAQWIILQDETLPVQSHSRLKAQFITIVTGNSNRYKFFKMIQFRIVASELNCEL